MTEENKIEQLLNAFYKGDTTTEEEAILLKYFNSKSFNEKWHSEKDILNALYDLSEITLPDGINERLENVLDNHIAETFTKKSEMQHKKIPLYFKTIKLYLAIISSAAAILLCACLFLAYERRSSSDLIVDTYTNPEEAAIAVEQALMLVSTKLNQGLTSLEKVKESIDKTNELINENLKINE